MRCARWCGLACRTISSKSRPSKKGWYRSLRRPWHWPAPALIPSMRCSANAWDEFPGSKQFREFLHGLWRAGQAPLDLIAVLIALRSQLLVDSHRNAMGLSINGADDLNGFGLCRHFAHKRLIDLDLVDRERAQVAQR